MTRECSNCGEPISEKRLAALKDTTRCISCASRRDLSPIEVFGQDALERVMVVGGDLDGEEFHVGRPYVGR